MNPINLFLFLSICLLSQLAHSSEHLSDHEQYCLNFTSENCLDLINTQLTAQTLYSKSWYKLKSIQLDYIYDIADYSELITQIEPLIDLPSAPTVFRTQLYFYYAKALNSKGDKVNAKIYADKAIAKLENMYEAFESPYRLLELANLHYVFGDRKRSYSLLLHVGNRFAKSKDAIFHFELNSNKANIFYVWDELDKSLKYRLLALYAIENTEHNSKIVVASGNVARTYQLLGQYESAIKHYTDSFGFMQFPKHNSSKAVYTLRLAELNWQSGNVGQAASLLAKVQTEDLKPGHLSLYNQLKTELMTNK